MTQLSQSNLGYVIIIFNNIPPYAYEVNNILALPNGFTYRFRFREKWIHGTEFPSQLNNHEGLVVLRDFSNAGFIPLRRIRLLEVLEVGDIVYINYLLKDIIEFDSNNEARERQLSEFNERMKAATIGFENKAGKNLDKLIFLYSDLAYGIEDLHYEGPTHNRPFKSWGNLIQSIGYMTCYTDFDFLKLIEIVDNNEQLVHIDYADKKASRFNLKNNTEYKLRVFQTTFTTREGDSSVVEKREIVLQGEPDEIKIIRSTYSIAGRYDLYQFHFKTASSSITKDTSLYLDIKRADIRLPNIEIPVRVYVSRLQRLVLFISIFFFILGVLLLFGADQIDSLTIAQSILLERLGILIAIISSYGIGSIAKAMLDKVQYQIG